MIKHLHIAFLTILCLSQVAVADMPTKVSMQLAWYHQFEHAGYYAALHKGFYKEVGLDVTLLEGGPETSAINTVVSGKATFGASSSGLVKTFIEGKPVLMLAPVFQHSPEVLITKKGLSTPVSVAKAGKIALQPGDESLDIKAMFVNEGISLDQLQFDHEHGSIDDLVDGKVVGILAYLSNETFLLKSRGIPFNILHPDDYGMDFYKGVLFTNSDYAKANPEVVKAFRAATLKGWDYALKHHDEIIGLILSQYNAHGKSRAHLQFEAQALHDLINPEIVELGHSNPWRWEKIAKTYAHLGIISNDFDLSNFAYNPNPEPKDLSMLYRFLGITLAIVAFLTALALYIFRINKQLKQANKRIEHTVVEQHQFINMISHELKTPIAVTSMAMDNLKGEDNTKQRAAQAIDDMHSILQRCEQVDMLERKQITPTFENTCLTSLIDKSRLASVAPERIQIKSDLKQTRVNTDPQLCQMIVANLLNNAIKYAAKDSDIIVYLSERPDKAEKGIQAEVINEPGKSGLPDETLLFNKYYRSQHAKHQTGTGLGLYLVKQLTELLRGTIAYDVTQGNIRLTLWLPS